MNNVVHISGINAQSQQVVFEQCQEIERQRKEIWWYGEYIESLNPEKHGNRSFEQFKMDREEEK